MESHAQAIPIVSRATYNEDRWAEVTKNGGRDLESHVPFKKFKVVCGIKPTMEPDPERNPNYENWKPWQHTLDYRKKRQKDEGTGLV